MRPQDQAAERIYPVRGQCDACGYRDTPLEEFGAQRIMDSGEVRRARYCEVCASTFASKAHSAPDGLTAKMLFRTLAIGFNLVLDAIHSARYGEKR